MSAPSAKINPSGAFALYLGGASMTLTACRLVDLGFREYAEVWRMQLELAAARQRDEVPDILLLVEHPDVITLGRSSHRENLRPGADFPVFEVERGGDATYHGPGQLVGYPILLLREHERDLHRYLRGLEEALIRVLGHFGIAGFRRAGWTGVWTADPDGAGPRKIASIGIAVKRWVTLHGFALNVATDLRRFAAINPCGLDASVMTSMASCLGQEVTLDQVREPLVGMLGEVFGRRFD